MKYLIGLITTFAFWVAWVAITPRCMGCDRPPPFGQGGYAEVVRWADMYHEACSVLPEKIFHRLKPYQFDLVFRPRNFSEIAGNQPCGG